MYPNMVKTPTVRDLRGGGKSRECLIRRIYKAIGYKGTHNGDTIIEICVVRSRPCGDGIKSYPASLESDNSPEG